MDWVGVAAESTVILVFLGGVFRYIILKPLNISINSLQIAINNLNIAEKEREEKRQEMDKRLVAVESSTKSAHHRIDHLEVRFDLREDDH